MLFGCEVGGHRQGLSTAALGEVSALASGAFRGKMARNYLTAALAPGVSLESTTRATPPGHDSLAPQLVIDTICVESSGRLAYLLAGNLHIRTPSGRKAPSVSTKQRIVAGALAILSGQADSMIAVDGHKHVAQVLVGDCNLTEGPAQVAVAKVQEPDTDAPWSRFWQIHPSRAGLGGDLMFIRGARAVPFGICVGASHGHNTVRNDCHDAVGAALRIPLSGPGLVLFTPLSRHP